MKCTPYSTDKTREMAAKFCGERDSSSNYNRPQCRIDTVDHEILIDVLRSQYGVCGTALNWVDSYLRPRSCRVSVNKTLSSSRLLQCSVH